ncbi:MAG: zinc ABC transporter substrate-binding protein, partial [Candidatus Thermoplasmatota archaeon]|nr:zinc ABC transporter substrate-binding protein [Candidatus Thermoplasmatota archaeon]
MKSNSYRVILVSLLMIFSSLAGCLEGDEEVVDEGSVGTVMVSTYHVGELVKAVAGDRVTLEYMSQDNIPVHDYEPSAQDIVRLQGADVFFYHGLGLEPWVDSTIESMGAAAPTAIGTHAMPGEEVTLDYEGMLVTELCELLTAGPYESTTLSMDEDDASEIHAEYVAHTLSFPEMEEDHDEHGEEDHDEHGEEDHDEHGEDGHDEHDHADHGHASPEEIIEDPADCPSETVISIFHMEEGEYILEFEEAEDLHEFNMAVLKMGGGHAHHDHHGHGDDHGDEEDHDDHGDEDDHDDHDDHGDDHDEEMTPEQALAEADQDNDGKISWDEFWTVWMSEDENDHDDHGDDGHGDHGDDDHDEHSHSVSVLYPDNTTVMFELDHDMLPENATGWDLTSITMQENNISLNSSVHEVYGNQVHGINGVDAPSDYSWWWALQIWNETSEAWEESSVGIDSVMMTHDDNDHIAWAASTANMSLLEEPGHHEEHDEHDPIEEAM